MNWGFEGDRYLAISIETRKEKGEQYAAPREFVRQDELVFVVADERDVVRLRTHVCGRTSTSSGSTCAPKTRVCYCSVTSWRSTNCANTPRGITR
jgi:hypothetical protein